MGSGCGIRGYFFFFGGTGIGGFYLSKLLTGARIRARPAGSLQKEGQKGDVLFLFLFELAWCGLGAVLL